MTTQLLEIKPQELKFTFEVRKSSSCSILLSNKSDECLAFKVKTTSPKKYSVRPNVGIINPKSTCDFTVTMLAQQVSPPPEMQCKDKFLIQCTVVPSGTSDKNITSDMFSKGSGNYIEEKKVRVVLVHPVQSPVLLPIKELNQELPLEISTPKENRVHSGAENIPPPQMDGEDTEGLETVKEATKVVDSRPHFQDVNELQPPPIDTQKLNLTEEFEDLKSKMALMESKLKEAELTIEKLTEERSITSKEKERLQNDIQVVRKSDERKEQLGFPFLFVCMVALISLTVGYYLARS